MNFEICSLIFPKFGDFKIPFEILRTSNIPIVRKITLRGKIVLQPEETIYAQVDYIGLSKGRSFIMTRIYPTASNAILDSTTFRIAILVNHTKKALKIDKSMRIATIYKCVDTAYLMASTSGMLTTLTAVSTTIFEPPSSVQRDIILGFRYQHVNLIGSSFQNGITAVNSEFTITLEIEAKLISDI